MMYCGQWDMTSNEKAVRAADLYCQGRSRRPYSLRRKIVAGMKSRFRDGEGSSESNRSGVCVQCKVLGDLRSIFDSLVHSGADLKRRRKIYHKPEGASYRNITAQNNYLLKTVFDGTGNYLYHRDCIRAALDVGSARLAHLRKTVQDQSSHPFMDKAREEVTHYSDVVLPKGCELPVSTWLQSQPEGAAVACRNTTRHGNAGKRSHNAKNEVILKRFLEFVDLNSSPNGRKEGSHGSTFFFNPKFTMLRTPDKKNAQYAYKCHHSVLFEFNRSLEEDGLTTISVGTFHSWLKQHRSYIGICPPQSDYCDKCKEYHEDISRARQIANRLKQSGNATEDSIREQERVMADCTALLQEHKEEAQAGFHYYKALVSETKSASSRISMLLESELTPETSAELETLKERFSAFISADYMMGKNLPHWGESAQPSKTYYMMKLVCDVFGIVDHSSDTKYAYICDETAAGAKSTDHTLTFLDHFVKMYIDDWVHRLTLCLDNARICKNQYLVAWGIELVLSGRFDEVRFMYLTVGHTKFAPDKLFSGIAKTFYNSDVFCIEMLNEISESYATSHVFTSRLMLHWRSSLQSKYPSISGISGMHDILLSKKSGKVLATYRKVCFNGDYAVLRNYKYNPKQSLSDLSPYNSVPLSSEKVRQLDEQHRRYIKQDVPNYELPTFLRQSSAPTATSSTDSTKQQKRKCTYPGCSGSGHVNPGRKRHLSEKNCPLAAKKPRS